MKIFDDVPQQCPSCGERRIVPVVYGEPSLEMMVATQLGHIVLSSRPETSDSPQWACQAEHCGYEF
jgi:primosomal protein N'